MPSPIQTIAPGLLSLIALKSQGMNPSKLLDEVRPTMEVVDWLAVQDREVLLFSGFVPAGATSQLPNSAPGGPESIPQGEVWYVHSVTAYLIALAADQLTLPICAGYSTDVGVTKIVVLAQGDFALGAPAGIGISTYYVAHATPRVWVPAGAAFGVGWGGFVSAAGGSTWQMVMEVTKLKI